MSPRANGYHLWPMCGQRFQEEEEKEEEERDIIQQYNQANIADESVSYHSWTIRDLNLVLPNWSKILFIFHWQEFLLPSLEWKLVSVSHPYLAMEDWRITNQTDRVRTEQLNPIDRSNLMDLSLMAGLDFLLRNRINYTKIYYLIQSKNTF